MVLSVTVVIGALLLFPGDLRHKAHVLLQGICAQRPSHSFQFSGQPLPVDARMTGIYLGAAASLLWFLLICRARYSGRLTRGTWVAIVVSISMMALDGLNSLAADLVISTPYATTNFSRVATGLLAGVAIGAFLSHLVTISLTHRPGGGWAPSPGSTLAFPLLLGALLCALAASGLPSLALPLTFLVIGSGQAVLWAMACVVVALALRRGWGFASAKQRDETLALAFLVACVLLLGLAGWRAALEQVVGQGGLS